VHLPVQKHTSEVRPFPLDPHWSLHHRFQVFKDQQPNPGTWTPGNLIIHTQKPSGRFAVELTALVVPRPQAVNGTFVHDGRYKVS
jgi:hypothetical protein